MFTTQSKTSFYYMVAALAANAVPIITLPIFTRVLSKEDFGILALSEMYAVFVAGIAFLGSSIAFERNYFAYEHDRLKLSQLIYSILAFVFFNFFILLTCTYFWGEGISQALFRVPGKANILTLDLCGTFFTMVFEMFLLFFRNRKEHMLYVLFSVANCALYLILSLFFLLGLHWSLQGILLAKFIALFLMSLFLFLRVHAHCPFSFSWVSLKESWKISLPLTPRIFFGIFSSRIDRYLINLLGTLGGVGIYSIGQKIGYLVFAFENALENVFSPHMYEQLFKDQEKARKALGAYLTPFFYLSAGGAMMLSLFSQEAIHIVFPTGYEGVAGIINIFCAYYVVLFFSKIAGTQLLYLKKTYITSGLMFLTYGLNIGLSIVFIKMWGANGAAFATLVTGIATTGLGFVIAQHFLHFQWPIAQISVIFLSFFGASIASWFLMQSHFPAVTVIMIKSIFVVLYIFLGLKLGLVDMFIKKMKVA